MKLRKFQMGGAMPEEAAMGAPGMEGAPMDPGMAPEGQMAGGGEDPVVQLIEMATQALQAQDPQLAMGVCEGLVQLAQQAGGGAPAPGGAPQEPVMARKGAKLVYKKGAKMRKKC